MKLWVGLGNPEASMQNNRHNIGFKAIDEIARHYCAHMGKKGADLVGEVLIDGEKILLLKPMTYMNKSGDAVQKWTHFFKVKPKDVVVFHDDLDVTPGAIRVKYGGGTAGHNGLKSINACLGTPHYWRVRIGIGHPGHRDLVTAWVLGNFSSREKSGWCDNILTNIGREAPLLAQGQYQAYQNTINDAMAQARV